MSRKWVPCKERLPNIWERYKNDEFIVMIKGAERPTTLQISRDKDVWYDIVTGMEYEVVAWQKMPKAYIEKGAV